MVDVVIVRWPEERAAASRLADAGAVLLYLVAADDDPPTPRSCLEDWVRIPGDERDLRAGVGALELRAAAHAGPPSVADDGLLHYRGKSADLSSVEARLAEVLTLRFSELVPDEVLIERVAAGGDSVGSLRAEIPRLRSHVRPVDLAVRRVANRGYRIHPQ